MTRGFAWHAVRSLIFVVFGLWLFTHTVATPGFVWLHAAFMIFSIAMMCAGAFILFDFESRSGWFGRLGFRVLAVALVLFGVLLLVVRVSPFGLLAIALGLQLFPWDTERPASGAGDGPLGSQHSQP